MGVEDIRMIERLLIVSGGIMCIYLGYRLFYKATPMVTGSGYIVLPLAKIKFTNLLPGSCFALFGAGILVVAMMTQIKVDRITFELQKATQDARNAIKDLPEGEPKNKFLEQMDKIEKFIPNQTSPFLFENPLAPGVGRHA